MKQLILILILNLALSCNGQKKDKANAMSNNIPDLSKPLLSGAYQIENVAGGTWNEILYNPTHDFYTIAQNQRIFKINNKGDVVYELDMNEMDPHKMPDFMDFHNPSNFVISWYGVYDLSKDKPYLEKFETILNEDESMEWTEWDLAFGNQYNNADVVLWGFRKSFGRKTYPCYFRKNGKWTVLYSFKGQAQTITHGNYVKFRVNKIYIPDKMDRQYLLKDENLGTYSNYNNYDKEFDLSDWPEAKLQYEPRASVETTSFKKEESRDAPYSNKPIEISGTAVNKLTIADSQFIFRSKAIEGTKFRNFPLQNFFNLFEIPSKYKTENSLSFLYYKYPSNWNEDGLSGVYVIKKKKD